MGIRVAFYISFSLAIITNTRLFELSYLSLAELYRYLFQSEYSTFGISQFCLFGRNVHIFFFELFCFLYFCYSDINSSYDNLLPLDLEFVQLNQG